MLTEKEINEIRTIIEKSNNPLYIFDNDGDGVCSYLMLKKHFKKGIGIPTTTAGALDKEYLKYVEEEKADLVVILDKAVIKQEFIDGTSCPVIYIDHHPIQKLTKIKYFNPLKHDKKSYIPTSYMVYKVVKSNLWLAVIGCLFDYKIPDFIKEFKKEYPDLVNKITKDPGYLKYKAPVSKLVKIFAFNMKGKIKDIKNSIRAMEKIETPYEIINQTTEEGKLIYNRYEKLNREYERLMDKGKACATKEKLLIFVYPSFETSFTSDVATELSYLYQNKTILVLREKDDELKLSMRDQKRNIDKTFKKAMEGLIGHGGGHPHAVGGSIKRKDFEVFVDRIKK